MEHDNFFERKIPVSRFFPRAEIIFKEKGHYNCLPSSCNEFHNLVDLLFEDLFLEKIPFAKKITFAKDEIIIETRKQTQPCLLPNKDSLVKLQQLYNDNYLCSNSQDSLYLFTVACKSVGTLVSYHLHECSVYWPFLHPVLDY